jgi:hypothetical protein
MTLYFTILTWYTPLKPPSDCAIHCVVDIYISTLIEGSRIVCLVTFPFWSGIVKSQDIDEVQVGYNICQIIVEL